jgi:alpha-L-fucosidase
MEVNQECIHSTRPWKVLGEGPQLASAAPLSAQGFNEGKSKPFTAEDVRFTQSKNGKTLYAIIMGTPTNAVTIKSLGANAGLLARLVSKIMLLGSKEKLKWQQSPKALVIECPKNQSSSIALSFKITY